MAKVIYEKREFVDRNTGVSTVYDYVAVAGTDDNSNSYEVALKNLTQAEKMVLKIIAQTEGTVSDVTARKASNDESPKISRSSNGDGDDKLDLFD